MGDEDGAVQEKRMKGKEETEGKGPGRERDGQWDGQTGKERWGEEGKRNRRESPYPCPFPR